MYSKVKTGDVIQFRKNGPNYIALGKVRDADGVEWIAATKNGNITQGGAMVQPNPDRRNSRGEVITPKIHIIGGDKVKRVHAHRSVDMASVCNVNRRLSTHLQRTNGRNGIPTEAPNIMVQIQDLAAAM